MNSSLVPGTILHGRQFARASVEAGRGRALREMLESWKTLGIDGWLGGAHPWYHLSEELGAACGRRFLGARAVQNAFVTGSTSVNLHQLLATFFRLRGQAHEDPDRGGRVPDGCLRRQESTCGCTVSILLSTLSIVPSTGGTHLDEGVVCAAM